MNRYDGLWLRRLCLTQHAADRIYNRIGMETSRARGEVRVALLEDRYADVCPLWTKHQSATPRRMQAGRFYAWDETFTRCWVIQRNNGVLWIVTVLLEHRERSVAAQRSRILPGMSAA